MARRAIGPIVAVTALHSVSAIGHHSTSIYRTDELQTIEGVVTEFDWKNPHTYIQIEVAENGENRLVSIEGGSISWLRPLGLSPDSLAVGDSVTVGIYPPSRDNTEVVLGREVIKSDGTVLPLNSLSPYIDMVESSGAASDISGTWVMENDAWEVMEKSQPSWAYTEIGLAVLAGYDGYTTPQSECVPMSVPNLMFYPVVAIFSIEEGAVRMRIDWMDSERTIYTDGRAHPDDRQRFLHGHSIGNWEDDSHRVLVIDTTNFSDHAAGSGFGIPSGPRKHVVERFELSDDGRTIAYTGTLESPEYLAEPVSFSFRFHARPDLTHSERGCDPDNARRFEVE